MTRMPLGKLPPTRDDRDIRFASVFGALIPSLPKPPARFGHGTMFNHGTEWQMLGNGPDDSVYLGFGGAGCCTISGGAHETMETNMIVGRKVPFTGKQVIEDYSAVTGYTDEDATTDTGAVVRDVLAYRKNVGLLDANGKRHKIGAYVRIDAQDWDQLMQACYVFSAVGIGFDFPESAWDQFDTGMPWDVVPGSRVDGGHYVPVMGRSSLGVAGAVTWGKRQGMTRAFYETYNDEAWAIIYPEELRNGVNERGLDLTALTRALAAIRQ